MTVRLAILFYSTYGTNQTMAEIAAEAARAAGAEVRLLRITETAPESVVRVRLRRVEAQPSGGSKPVVLAEATRSLATGAVALNQG